MERLQKVIANAGIASRRHAEVLIEEGHVVVNGTLITTLGTKVNPLKDHIKVNGKLIHQSKFKSVYLMLNKPCGTITSVRDPEGRPTVMDLIPKGKERLYPVGRLDFNTEGLLLLTNDGEMANKLMHPRFEIEKKYWVKVKGHPTETEINKLRQGGISLPTGKSAPCGVRMLPPRPHREGGKVVVENSWLEVILHEGKKREVRHLMDEIGHLVLKLKRVSFASLTLGSLPVGACRALTPKELAGLQKQIGNEPAPATHQKRREKPKRG
jgi:23S rRNA pseudouridine2605 synthase